MNSKGFTLVELIVVIAILSILGTLAFLKVQPYLWHSRNTVRMDSIAKITSKIDSYLASEKPIMSITGTGGEVVGASIGGTGATQDVYKSGVPNYNTISLHRGSFKDPSSKDDYLLGITSKVGGKYNIAFAVESDEGVHAKVEGTWFPRESKIITGTAKVNRDIFLIENPANINHFYVGDVVTGVGISSGTYIKAITKDGRYITLSQKFSLPGTGIQLVEDEIDGLVASKANPAVPVTNYSPYLPYIIQ